MLPLIATSQVFDKTLEALNTKNMALLEQYMDNSVDITFVDDHKHLNKKKATAEIENFLISQGSVSAKRRHKGNSKENNSNYRVLHLNATNANFRVFVYTEKVGDKQLIKELRFDEI